MTASDHERPIHAAEVRSYETGEVYGVGVPGVIIHRALLIEGNQRAVLEHPEQFWSEVVFDLPVALGLGDQRWQMPLAGTVLRARLLRCGRGEELWSSTDTTMLPAFTRVKLRSHPALAPARTHEAVEAMLAHIDRLLDAAGQQVLQPRQREGFTVRGSYFVMPDRQPHPFLTATIPLWTVVEAQVPDQTPLTPEIIAVAEQHRRELTRFVIDRARNEPFATRVVRSVHDFGFYCRQHAPTLSLLQEEQLRDLLLIPQQQLFSAEGEAMQYCGKTDIKVVNPDSRYEFAVVELKVWDGDDTVAELLDQGFSDHVTGQEAHIVLQVISRRQDFGRIVEKVRHLVQDDDAVTGPLRPVNFGSKEHLFESTAVVHESEVPFTLSIVNLSTTRTAPRSARKARR